MYYRLCHQLLGESSASVESDNPVVWLEKQARFNKNWLAVVSIFNVRFAPIVRRLSRALDFLIGVPEFNQEREKYNIRKEKLLDRKERRVMKREMIDLKEKKWKR